MWLPFRRKALTATPAVLDTIRSGNTFTRRLGPSARERVTQAFNQAQSANLSQLYLTSPAVRTVLDVIVRNVGQLDLRLFEEISETERQPRPEHPAALSLRYPNEDTTSDGFIRSFLIDKLIVDNAYALMTPAAGGQVTFNWLPAASMEIGGPSAFKADFYRYWRRDGSIVQFDADAIMHWKGESPTDPRMGSSRLDTLRAVIAEDAALQAAIIELAESGMAEAVAFKRPLEAPPWSNQARDGFEEDLSNRIRRRNKKPIVLEEGMEPVTFGVSPRDAQMFEVRRWAIERVASAYGVPLGMVGLADATPEAQSQFYADTLPPYCEDMTRMLNHRLLVRVYNWTEGCFEFNLDEKHMGDDRLKSLTSATGRPVMLTNEARAKINLPPVEGGDELVTPSNVIVGEKPSVDVMPIQDPNGPAQDGSHREEPPKALPVAPDVGPLVKADMIRPMSQQQDLNRQLRNIELAEKALDRHFTRMARWLEGKAVPGDWARWDRELGQDLKDLLSTIVETEGTIYAFKLGGEFDPKQVQNYLDATAEGAAEGINAAVKADVEAHGVEGAVNRFPQHVASAGASLGANLTMWARTEAAKQAPDFERRQKTWIPNTNRHAAFGGQTVAVGDPWPAGFAPGSAPGCRCSMSIS